jgi:hypothetical protein
MPLPTTWHPVPPEINDPVLLHASTRKSVACFWAVRLRTGKSIRSLSATFENFLKTTRIVSIPINEIWRGYGISSSTYYK